MKSLVIGPIGVGEGVAGGMQPPYLSRNLLHSGNFPERTVGNVGSFTDYACCRLGRETS